METNVCSKCGSNGKMMNSKFFKIKIGRRKRKTFMKDERKEKNTERRRTILENMLEKKGLWRH